MNSLANDSIPESASPGNSVAAHRLAGSSYWCCEPQPENSPVQEQSRDQFLNTLARLRQQDHPN